MTIAELKKMLEAFPDDMKVVSASFYRDRFEDLYEPRKVHVKKEEVLGVCEYEPLYSTEAEKADEEVVVI